MIPKRCGHPSMMDTSEDHHQNGPLNTPHNLLCAHETPITIVLCLHCLQRASTPLPIAVREGNTRRSEVALTAQWIERRLLEHGGRDAYIASGRAMCENASYPDAWLAGLIDAAPG
ncbi:hypothetical protein EJ05DRAFT_480747, partial [Pseudovirgaria hyperparasitica]